MTRALAALALFAVLWLLISAHIDAASRLRCGECLDEAQACEDARR